MSIPTHWHLFRFLEELLSNPNNALCEIEVEACISCIQTGVLTLGYNVNLSYIGQSDHSFTYIKNVTPKLTRLGSHLEP